MKLVRCVYLRLLPLLFIAACLNAAIAPAAHGALTLTPVLQGLGSPVYVTNAHDGTNRLFVVEQAGRIQALAPGATTPTVFLDIVSKVRFGGEQGLLGLAFHPQFATNSRFFVNYTRQPDGATVIAEYHASPDPAATAASEIVLLVVPQPESNHNGGMIEFGNDGYLYIGMGDGGGGNDPNNHAQNINDLLGKILRIDIDNPAGGNPYSSPASNPYFGATPGRDEIFALGMRNPYRFSFDRQTGQLYVGDVGQNLLEEVDIVTAGGNYGWRVYEANNCTGLDPALCNPANFVPPITQYDHTGGRCSIIGGYVYRGTAATLPLGTYVFADFCSGTLYSLVGGSPNLLIDTSLSISSLGEDEAREIYVVGLGGTVHRLTQSGATSTTLVSSPNPAALGAAVTFTATVNGTSPTGSVAFVADSGPPISGCGTVAFIDGPGNSRTAVCTTGSLASGTHSIVATYSGDAANLSSSNTPPLTQVVSLGTTPAASASFVATDAATHGNWKGVYGSDGYAIFGDSTSYPAYAQVTTVGKADFTWAAQPDAESRALQRALSGRIAACWYGSSFNVDLNLTDQATHRVAMYLLDWDTGSRITRVDVLDAGTQQVLATQTVQSFHDGVYLVWDLQGHVILRVTNVSGANAVLSGLFFGAAGASGGAVAWNNFGRDAQHTALSTTASQPLNQIHWQMPVDLQPQYSGTSLLIHYGSPVITPANTVIVPVKTGATDGFRVEARAGGSGALKWSMTSDYTLPPHNWVPAFGPALTSQSRLYFPGAGGTVYFRDQADAAAGPGGQIAFYGLANYQANPQSYSAGVAINTPLTVDPSGNLYFGFHVIGSTPLGLTSGIARISASGQGTWIPVTTASADPNMTKVPHNSAPALSTDLQTLYVAVSNGSAGYLVALDSTTLAPVARVLLTDPASGQSALVSDNGSASPTVGTDGDVYFGVLDNPFGSNHRRGWLLHFNGSLSQSKTPGAFGWDDTVSLVPSPMVAAYQGTSAYLLMAKYNHYLGLGGDGQNKLAILDPNATQIDPVTGGTVMKEVLTILGPTPESGGGVKEWCINTAAVDPFTKSVLANNEDGKLYRWDLTTNTLSQTVVLTAGLGEAYTSTVIGPDGKVYATNNATLFAVGQ